HMSGALFGRAPEGRVFEDESPASKAAFFLLGALVLALGLAVPAFLSGLLREAAAVLTGV
ncbi:MAG TPA: hypothetical protein PL037_08040, partial [Elusimicrobiales bacterium]|nr:hypothetical protein [Elusimicrobiales bacterium]